MQRLLVAALLAVLMSACGAEVAPPDAEPFHPLTRRQPLLGDLDFEAEGPSMAHKTGRRDLDGWSANTAADSANHLLYGPYTTTLPEGKHVATFRLLIDNNSADNLRVVYLDIFDATSNAVLGGLAVTRKMFSATHVYLDFAVPFTSAAGHSLETRVWWDDRAFIRIDSVSLSTEDAARTAALVARLSNVKSATRSRYALKDSLNTTMDALKVIADPWGGYLGVYHVPASGGFTTRLATSTDLLTWSVRVDLQTQSSQPTIAALGNGGYLVVTETNRPGQGPRLNFRHYPTRAKLFAGVYDRTFDAPRTLSNCAEGTPSLSSVTLAPDIDHSVIEVGLHYFANCNMDRQARGTLRNFDTWGVTQDPVLDAVIVQAAGTAVNGNIGDRDEGLFRGGRYQLVEGQTVKNDFGSWRTYLYDFATGGAQRLNILTHGGSQAFANPTFTVLPAPSGRTALLTTLFVPSEGSAPGEAGSLLYYVEL